MPRARAFVEVWTELQAAGGSRLATIPDVLALSDVQRLTGEHGMTLELPVKSPAYAHVRAQRVARVAYTDGSFDEWRLARPTEKRTEQGLIATIAGAPVRADLARAILSRTEADGSVWYEFEALQLTATQHFDNIIAPILTAHGLSHFALGTVDSSANCDLVYSSSSVLDALVRIANALDLELHIRRNGTTGYLIDLLSAIGSAATPRQVFLGRDLLGIERAYDTSEQATRIIPRGAAVDGFHATMARARWRVAAITGSDLTLEDPNGGAGPIAFDDQLNGLYVRKTNGTLTQITDSVASTQKVTVASATSISVGHLVEIRLDSSGTDLTYLEAPADKTTYGLIARPLDRPEIPGTVNLITNPAIKDWSAGVPTGWVAVLTPTITETTTANRWRHGGKSARVQTASDGAGISTPTVDIAPTAAQPHFSGYIGFWLVSGRVRVDLVTNAGLVIPNGTTDGKAFSTETETWIELGVAGIDLNTLGATTARLRILQDGAGTAEFYVDAAQLTQTTDIVPFLVGAGPNQLWQEANRQLLEKSQPLIQIAVDLVDIHRMNPTLFPTDEIVLGGTVRVKDTQLGIDTTTRFAEIQRDLLKHGISRVALTNRTPDLSDRFSTPPRPTREVGTPVTPATNHLVVRIDRLSETAEKITVRVRVIGASAPFSGQSTLTVTVSYDAGGLTVSPASGQTLTATASFATTGTIDYEITKPASGSSPRRVSFTATASGHLDGTDGVDVANRAPLIMRIDHVSADADEVVVRVRVAAPNQAATVTVAYDAGGLSISPASGGTLTPTSDLATTGTIDYTITRPAQGSPPTRVAFTASAAGYEHATDGMDVLPKLFAYGEFSGTVGTTDEVIATFPVPADTVALLLVKVMGRSTSGNLQDHRVLVRPVENDGGTLAFGDQTVVASPSLLAFFVTLDISGTNVRVLVRKSTGSLDSDWIATIEALLVQAL